MRTKVSALASLVALLAAACTGAINGGAGTGDGSGGGAGGGDDDEFNQPDAAVCDQTVPITVTQVQKTPDMLLVVDKSGSMNDPLGGGGASKMDIMKQAMATVLPGENANIRFGLALYPSVGDCGAAQVTSGIVANNASSIVAQINSVQPQGATPTHTSLDAARAYYSGIAANPDGRYVLLATDGIPNCNGTPQTPSNAQSIQAAERLADQGINVFVIGFGDIAAADPTFLTQMAQAGGTANFFAANSPTELQAALREISGTVVQASCDFKLASVPESAAKLAVTVDGQPVPRDPAHNLGWDYDAATNSIIFYGVTCEAIKSGNLANVSVDYGCGGEIIG